MPYDPLDPDADCFRLPDMPTLVGCLHCQQDYDSYRIEWRIFREGDGKEHGFWCCPIEGCDGTGFGFDIDPVDHDYRGEDGERMWIADGDDDIEDGLGFPTTTNRFPGGV